SPAPAITPIARPSATIASDRAPVVSSATASAGNTPTNSIQTTADTALVLREARPPKKFDNPIQPADANANTLDTHGTDIAAQHHPPGAYPAMRTTGLFLIQVRARPPRHTRHRPVTTSYIASLPNNPLWDQGGALRAP